MVKLRYLKVMHRWSQHLLQGKCWCINSTGILEIRPNSEVYLLADTSERAEHIDIERAEAAKARAEELLKRQENDLDIDFARIQSIIERETARISVGRRYRDVR
ncbi:MAG: ATP synthase epsilon chain [Candidatus Magasanikbacteria bacterium GW2011_GWD2_43_18]|nr:MAG: ATP synthase epsilon chain [Candidatus Magasanikbacteria bacterium GW2011_GWD2_43_18]